MMGNERARKGMDLMSTGRDVQSKTAAGEPQTGAVMSDKQHGLARFFNIFTLAVIIFFAAHLVPAQAQSGSLQEFVPGEVLVELKPGASIEAVIARYGMSMKQRIYGTNFYNLLTPKQKKEAKFRKRLAKDADVLSASLNPVI